MSTASSTYYGLTKVREMGPDANDWAATDSNFEMLSLIMKALEQHHHDASVAINSPGYNIANPAAPTLPILTEVTSGGTLSPGTALGVRLSYVNSQGLESAASPEVNLSLSPAAARPLTPILVSTQSASPGLAGGTYIYVVTKTKATGETVISDVLPVTVPYDTTYSITIQFDPINSYTDGTTGLNIYRSTGLSSSFQIIGQITTVSQTQFTDTNQIAVSDINAQPPTTSTFDSSRKLHINWAAITIPSGATRLRVYVTQQTGIWPFASLLSDIDLSTGPATYVEYLGNETLATGAPNNVSAIPNGAPKVNLATEAFGAPVLTANMDFSSYQALNLRLQNTASPPTAGNGAIYYDSSTNNVRAYINGAWVNWGTSTASAYVHPAEEVGGHIAANVKFASGSAVTSKTVFDTLRNSDGTRKQTTKVYKNVGATSGPTTIATSYAGNLIPEMIVTVPNADIYTNNAYADISFSGSFFGDTPFMVITIVLEVDGTSLEESIRSVTVPTVNGYVPVSTQTSVPLASGLDRSIRVLWSVTNGTATAAGTRRALVAKLLF